jgi:[ribosomal protein S18]-alanine N-acetyltransferase
MSRIGKGIRRERDFYLAEMTEHDLLEVVEIEETCGLSRWGWDAYHAELAENRNSIMLVARWRGSQDAPPGHSVLGFIAARLVAGELHINNVAVRPQCRRLGMARGLLETAINEATRRGAHAAFLEVRAGNEVAQALYRRCGFRVVGRRAAYYTQPREDALVMNLSLRNPA